MGSTIPDFGELKTPDPRMAWPHEARDFTPWLASHISNLGQVRDSTEREASPRAESYRRFFQALIDELRETHRFTGAKVGQAQRYSFASGVSGFWYNTNFTWNGRVRAELYIDLKNTEKNKATFDALLAQKDEIEREFGEPLEWERQDDKPASRVAIYLDGAIEDSDQRLAEIRTWCVDHLLKLKRVFGRRLTDISV